MTPARGGSGRGRRTVLALVGAVGAGVLGYAAYAATTWYSYGRRHPGTPDDLLDRFMPAYEVSERHAIDVAAPAAETFAAARAIDVYRAPLARAIFAARELPARLRGASVRRVSRSLVDETQALGWRVLAEVPGRALVMARTRSHGRRKSSSVGFRRRSLPRSTSPATPRSCGRSKRNLLARHTPGS